jgi:plastocyanin
VEDTLPVRRPGTLIALFLAGIFIAAAVVFTAATSAASQSGPTLRVKAGLGQGVVSVNQYPGDPAFPEGNTVRVAEGTTVIWSLGSDEPHTVTFRAGEPWPPVFMPQLEDPARPPMMNPRLLNPTVPNGPWDGTSFVHMELQSPGQELRLTFGRQGNFRYSCLFHEEMDGYVEVVAPGAAGITTQAAVDEYAATHLAREHAQDAAQLIATRGRANRLDGPDGTNVWFVRSGTNERRGHMDINAFLPDALTVMQGDTVVWYVDHVQPHTVTFHPTEGGRLPFVAIQLPDGQLLPAPAPGEAPPPEVMAALADPENAPRVVMVGALPTRPSPAHDGRSGYSSGLFGEHPLVTYPMEKTWALTFGAPGVYQYDCEIHEVTGMKGTITVVAR